MSKKTNVILRETKNLMRSFTNVQDDNQAGRSMVEMLGVLAVIGVLSVAGIAGYTSAMRQYKANEIVNATSVLYIMAQSQKQGQGDNMNYTSIGAAPTGTSQISYDNTTKAITITFTDDTLCPSVKNKLGDKAGECTVGSLIVTFGETASTPVVDLSDLNTSVKCEAAGYYWLQTDPTCSEFFTCYHSRSEAIAVCESVDYCSFKINPYMGDYCEYKA